MRILLINPPIENMIKTEMVSFVDFERGYTPPLGIMYVAAILKEKTDHDIKILDCQVERLRLNEIKKRVVEFKPDIVGVSVMTFTLVDCLIIARAVKDIDNNIKVIFGGTHVNIYPKETINFPEVDFLVLGEGESNIVDLIENIGDYNKLKKVKGIIFKEKNKIINTELSNFIENLDKIPFPARELTPYKKYFSIIAKRKPITSVITSRGCPYKCLFCDRPHLGKKFRARSAKNVVDEFEECVELGIKEFLVYDDNFCVNKKRVYEICEDIKKRGLDVCFDIRTRIDSINKELLLNLKKAGCERIHYGVESGNNEILKILKKGINVEQIKKVFAITNKIGIENLAYFMIGAPGETEKTIKESINLAKEIKPNFVLFTIASPFPATEMYKMALSKGIVKKDVWKEFAENPNKNFKVPFWEENFKREQLIELLKYAYKNFYIRPRYIIKTFFEIRSLSELKRKARMGFKILGM